MGRLRKRREGNGVIIEGKGRRQLGMERGECLPHSLWSVYGDEMFMDDEGRSCDGGSESESKKVEGES